MLAMVLNNSLDPYISHATLLHFLKLYYIFYFSWSLVIGHVTFSWSLVILYNRNLFSLFSIVVISVGFVIKIVQFDDNT